MINTPQELRSKRIAAEISATLLATRAKVSRAHLSNIERGYAQPTTAELQQLTDALQCLIDAKAVIRETAHSVGWPAGPWNG
jgi:transcriptional regulator with XRE-family HTH domain